MTNVEKCEFAEMLYTYNGDQVMFFVEETFEYDIIGNPTTYRGKTAEWEKDRQLKKFGDLEFTYDGQGRRRTKGEIQFTYDSNGNLINQSNGLEFIYDLAGVAGVKYNRKTYLYRKDAQGNIIALLDSIGNVVVKYAYDAWGNHAVLDSNGNNITSATHIGTLNPFRYRGYYYDTETGLYYLQTRYYDPELCRFMTIDSIENIDPETINGLNLYAYCGDNPVMGYDPEGTWDWGKFWKILGIVVGTVLFVAAVVASAGTVGALAGAAAAAIGLSTAVVSTVTTVATVATYVVATGIALFGISDAVEVGTNGFNPIRDTIMGGNQTIYNAFKITFDVLGTFAIIAGAIGPKVLQRVAQKGIPTREGFKLDFFDKKGAWSMRIDATVHGNPKYHHNPHIHYVNRSGGGRAVYYFWQVIKSWFVR